MPAPQDLLLEMVYFGVGDEQARTVTALRTKLDSAGGLFMREVRGRQR
jgi:hypothetical protein